VHGGWRAPESSLHLLTLLGGTADARLGQAVFRHKTRTQPFRKIFLAIVTFQAAILVGATWLWTT